MNLFQRKTEKDGGKLVFSYQIAKKLLENGHTIIGIKPHRQNPDKTVFVFEDCAEVNYIIEEMKK